MSSSSHRGLIPKADPGTRGQHPDLNENGDPLWDTTLTANVADRDFDRMSRDPERSQHFLGLVAAEQSLEPETVQTVLSGKFYEGSPSQGYAAYRRDRAEWQQWIAESNNKTTYRDDAMIERMSLDEYERDFDEAGRPRDHVYYHPNRSVKLDDQMDTNSTREYGNRP